MRKWVNVARKKTRCNSIVSSYVLSQDGKKSMIFLNIWRLTVIQNIHGSFNCICEVIKEFSKSSEKAFKIFLDCSARYNKIRHGCGESIRFINT